MKIRELLLILLYVTFHSIHGKSIVKHGRKHSSIDKGPKHNRNVQKTKTLTNDNLTKRTSENLSQNTSILKQNDKSNLNNADCAVNCTIMFGNPKDDGGNLMEEDTKSETGDNSGSSSGDNDHMVEQDAHTGTENSQNVRNKGTDNALAPAVATPPNLNSNAKYNSGTDANKQVALTPQSSVQDGAKSAVSNMSATNKYPSLPVPHMIPLPLFYNSGDAEGSAAKELASDTKNTTQMDEVNGKLTNINHGSVLLHKGKRRHHHSGNKVEIQVETPLQGSSTAAISPVNQTFTSHIDGNLASAKPGGGGVKVAAPAQKQTPLNVRDAEETTTDYPFVVSDGPKANIHSIKNAKINIGSDHDEDLVDFYDDDDDSEDPSSSQQYTTFNGDADSEEESGDSDTVPTFDENGDTSNSQQSVEGEEDSSGSGSGHTPVDYSGDTGETKKKAPKKSKKVKTKTFEFGPGELGDNNLPIVVPVITKHPQDKNKTGDDMKDMKKNNKGKQTESSNISPPEKDITKVHKKGKKEKWIVHNVKVNKDIKSILNQFHAANHPKYVAPGTAPQALGQPNIKANVSIAPLAPVPQALPPNAPIPQALPPQGAVNRDIDVSSLRPQPIPQQGAPNMTPQPTAQNVVAGITPNPAVPKKVDSGVSGFLQNGVGTKILNEIAHISGVPLTQLKPPVAPSPVVQQQQVPLRTPTSPGKPCLGVCLTSCSRDCNPVCCRSGFSLGDGVTAEILPIPEDLNKVIKDAGLGPGTTAQILPNDANRKMLQQAGFKDGVMARIIPIPAGYDIFHSPYEATAASRSDASLKQPQGVARAPVPNAKPNVALQPPQLAPQPPQLAPPAAQLAPPAAQLAPPAAQLAPPAAQLTPPAVQPRPNIPPPLAQQQASRALPAPPQVATNLQPPRPAVNQQTASVPDLKQTQEPSARDIKGVTALTDTTAEKQSPINQQQQPTKNDEAAVPPKPAEIVAKIETLPDGVKNYDEASYADALAQLPDSMKPDQPVLRPLQVSQSLSQMNVNVKDHVIRHPVKMFFPGMKRQDPFQNLEAYKRQEFKNYDLVDDR